MIWYREKQVTRQWEGDCKSHRPQDDLKHFWSPAFRGQGEAGWWLALEELVLTPPLFQLERSLLSCRGEWVHSVSTTLDPTQLRTWDIRRGKLILLRVFIFASRKLMAWLSPWAMGKIWNEANLFANFSTVPDPELLRALFCKGKYSLTVKRKDLQWMLTAYIAVRHREFSAWKEIMTE